MYKQYKLYKKEFDALSPEARSMMYQLELDPKSLARRMLNGDFESR